MIPALMEETLVLLKPDCHEGRKCGEVLKRFEEAGFEWRAAGCSMCLAMNPDKLVGDQLCASSSNRNFKGRQGSPTGRTVLMSPVMVAAAAVTGSIADAREVFNVDPATAAA